MRMQPPCINGIEVRPLGLDSIEFDDAGAATISFVPIRPGDVIHTRNVLHEVYEKTGRTGSMVFVVSRQTLTNQRGEMIAVIDSRFMLRPKERAE